MKGKRGQRRESRAEVPAGPPPAATGEPAAPATRGRRLRKLMWDVLTGVIFAALILSIKLLIEHSRFGEELDAMSYNLLQVRLTSDRVPVKLLDISDLRPEPFNVDGQVGIATPRHTLQQLIEALVQDPGARPKAIGIDIDFSPEDTQYIHPDDPEFFQFCLDTAARTRVPIFLGVQRTNTKPPEDWLGGEEYQSLAADLSIPSDRRKVLRWVKAGEGGQRLASFSAALADTYAARTPEQSGGWWRLRNSLLDRLEGAHLVEKTSEKTLAPGLEVGEFLVDFSSLDRLSETKLHTVNPIVVKDQAEQFKGKVVLLGDATSEKAEDRFTVPGREGYFPGVYLHAAAATTLIDSPLYEVTHEGRVVIDLLLSGVVILGAALVSFFCAGRSARRVDSHRLQWWLILVVVVAAMALGVLLVRLSRVMWSDFILALGMLAIHPSVEERVKRVWGWFRRSLPRALEAVVYKSEKEEGH